MHKLLPQNTTYAFFAKIKILVNWKQNKNFTEFPCVFSEIDKLRVLIKFFMFP